MDWLEIIGFVEMVFMPSFYGVNKAGSSETIFGGCFVNFFFVFQIIHGSWDVDLLHYITAWHDDDMSFPNFPSRSVIFGWTGWTDEWMV